MAAVKTLKGAEWSAAHEGTPFSLEKFVQAQPHHLLVVVKYGASWCGPCRTIAPVFESLAAKGGPIGCYDVDVDNDEEIAVEADVSALPTFIFYTTQLVPKGTEGLAIIDKLTGPSAQELQQSFAKAHEIVAAVTGAPPAQPPAPPVAPVTQVPPVAQSPVSQAPPVVQTPPVAQPPATTQPAMRPNDIVKRELLEIRASLLQALQRTERLFSSLQ